MQFGKIARYARTLPLMRSISHYVKTLFITLLIIVSVSSVSYATYDKDDVYEGWRAKNGNIVPNSDNMKSIKGFGGWLVITSDADWEEKWNTPTYVSPEFNEASNVYYGQKLTILTFFINPKVSDVGSVNITCGVKITRPDDTISVDNQNIECLKDIVIDNPRNVHLSPIVIDYIGEEGDPPGEWVVEVNINDINRGAYIPLKNTFMVIQKANKTLNMDAEAQALDDIYE